jgi:spore coat polysaccharide biosynthesis protein SpsF (cytidylyltransferase family)
LCDTNYEKLRWTLDNQEDYGFLASIFNDLSKPNSFIGWRKVIEFIEKNKDVQNINSYIKRNEGFIKSLKEDKKIR